MTAGPHSESLLSWPLTGEAHARPLERSDAGALWQLIAANRAHLDRWLRWSSLVRSLEDAGELIETFTRKREHGDGFHSGIWHGETLVGGVVVWYIHRQNRNAEVGYWLGTDALGRGLATSAARAAVDFLFRHERLHRVEMQCGVDNVRSRAIPERLGFRLEGIRRESHWITDRFVDHAVYGLLASEWQAARSP